ncbi:MAG: HisS family protein, partial [Patescibacteria group bacterium]
VGSDSPLADAEVIAAVSAALKDLGIDKTVTRINNRRIIDGILLLSGVSEEKWILVMRELDKLDKVGAEAVKQQLEAGGVGAAHVKKLFEFINADVFSAGGLQDFFDQAAKENKTLAEGIGELSDVLKALAALGVKNTVVDLKLARGLDYYTRTVCEIVLSEQPQFGSIAGGGRYDNLIGNFAGGKEKIPAVGMSIGIDRLIAALEELPPVKSESIGSCLVFNLDEKLQPVYLKVVNELRACGIGADIYYRPDDLDKQFRYAEKKNIILGLFIGEEEIRKGEVNLKNLKNRKQWKVKAEKLAVEVKKALE